LIGINCTHQPHNDFLKIDVLKRINQPVFTILIYHSPDLILELNSQKIDLMLSGHTHGGQVRLPLIGALFTGSLYGRNLQAGEYWFHNTMLYITRGIGLEGLGAPRVRFLWTIHH
jgi:predicted MPP superfamily phosphohydrolase